MVLSNGHMCDGGNRTIRWSQFCDGIIDCYDRFDEEGHFCKLCINNLYSCPPKDDIRCDLACKMLHYVPCQTIQDRRACNNIENNFATIILILILIGIAILIKYLIRRHEQNIVNTSFTPSNFPHVSNHPIETDTLSSHIYEQCYEPPSYETAQKYPLMKTYYEHVV
ncbi:unnamed protein product [Rotaria sp. Silwood2]|nr:unnamed protein product [Rotaria sp. Silwood2]CAF2811480.1 unnamed protein product [Rotaria sp. Silwood2]CAF3090519.1 unnamed protein product [Rotaria sp. Silwood2]CAF3267013.1 unnamed protein product [Rotaria sp. Silwood2]CAF4092782.1 unnamed protein product [Rotaria sp. Silwood2]